ncbi:MAG: transposase family protein, partial [Mastigocoleus sp.]
MKELTIEEKNKNKQLASERIYVEHLIRLVKVFKVAQERFRLNSRKYEQ